MVGYIVEYGGAYLLVSGQVLFVIGSMIETRLPDNFSLDKYDFVEHKFGAFGLGACLCALAGLALSVVMHGLADGMFISVVLSLPAILLELSSRFLRHASSDVRRKKHVAESAAR